MLTGIKIYFNLMKIAERMYSKYSSILEFEDCYDLAEDILEACSKKAEFLVPLKEWMNGKTKFQDYILNGFSMVELAFRLNEKTPNIPIDILIFYLEENVENTYRALSVVADQICVCDKILLTGSQCKYAIKDEGMWYFLDNDPKTENLKECQMWQVLLLNLGLIAQMTYEHTDGTAIILQDDESYLIELSAAREE